MEKRQQEDMSNNWKNNEIAEKTQHTDDEHRVHKQLLTDTKADGLTDCKENNREETKDENRKSLDRNVEISESDSSTSSVVEINYILKQKIKLSMMQTSFREDETLADGLDFDTNPSYINEFRNKSVHINEHNEDEKIGENKKECLDTSLVKIKKDEELKEMYYFNNNQVIENNEDKNMAENNEERLDTSPDQEIMKVEKIVVNNKN